MQLVCAAREASRELLRGGFDDQRQALRAKPIAKSLDDALEQAAEPSAAAMASVSAITFTAVSIIAASLIAVSLIAPRPASTSTSAESREKSLEEAG